MSGFIRSLVCILTLGFLASWMPFFVVAKKLAMKRKKALFTLQEAYRQRTVAGVKDGAPPPAGYYFVIRWNTPQAPGSFFWRGDGGFMPCDMQKVHKVSAANRKSTPAGIDYLAEAVMPDQVRQGDTLMLTPLTRGKFAVPAEIPASAKNTLYYKAGTGSWEPYPVAKIATKQDIVMP